MARWAALAAGFGLVTGLAALVPVTASAAAGPTVSAPATAAYYSLVPISGTTPVGEEQVVVSIITAATPSWHAVHTLTSDSSGRYATTIRAGAAFSVRARAGGVDSAARTVKLPATSCTVSGAVARNPISAAPPTPHRPGDKFMAFTASYNGLWAGYAFLDYPLTFDVISWRSGQATPTVLRSYRITGSTVYYPEAGGTVSVVGVTPSGAVVAGIRLGPEELTYTGDAWYGGRMYTLTRPANWTSVQPVGVTGTGAIVGVAHSGPESGGTSYLVHWSSITAAYHVITSAPGGMQAAVGGSGDIAYSTADGSTHLITAGSTLRRSLTGPGGTQLGAIRAGAGRRFWFSADGGESELAISSATVPATAPSVVVSALVSPGSFLGVTSAGSGGDLLFHTDAHADYLRTSRGAVAKLQMLQLSEGVPGGAVNSLGTAAFTHTDGSVRFVHCT